MVYALTRYQNSEVIVRPSMYQVTTSCWRWRYGHTHTADIVGTRTRQFSSTTWLFSLRQRFDHHWKDLPRESDVVSLSDVLCWLRPEWNRIVLTNFQRLWRGEEADGNLWQWTCGPKRLLYIEIGVGIAPAKAVNTQHTSANFGDQRFFSPLFYVPFS